MHVAFYQFTPTYGGADRCLVEFASRLKERVQVSIVDPYGTCQAYRAAVESAGVDYYVVMPQENYPYIERSSFFSKARSCRRRWWLERSLKFKTEALLKRLNVTVACTFAFAGGAVLSSTPFLRSIPCCYYLHSWYCPPQMTNKGLSLLRMHASRILGVSYATMQACICQGIDRKRVFALSNPIDFAAYESLLRRPVSLPLPQMHRNTKILVPSDIRRGKRIDLAVRAMRYLRDRGIDAVLWILGGSSASPGKSYADEIHKIISAEGVGDMVEWLGYREDLPQVMASADVCVLPSDYEGLPRVVLESMVARTPFVSTPAGGCANIVLPGLTGWVVPFSSPCDIANAIENIITFPQRTEKIVDNAYQWVTTEFSSDRHCSELLKHLKQCE